MMGEVFGFRDNQPRGSKDESKGKRAPGAT